MRQGSIRAAPRAGPATVARMYGPVGPFRGRRPAWADNESSWAVPPEDVLEDPVDEPDVLYLATPSEMAPSAPEDSLPPSLGPPGRDPSGLDQTPDSRKQINTLRYKK
jgi:hypothetical protein